MQESDTHRLTVNIVVLSTLFVQYHEIRIYDINEDHTVEGDYKDLWFLNKWILIRMGEYGEDRISTREMI